MLIRHLSRATRHLLFWSLILLAVLLSSARVFLASIDLFKADLEQQIRQMADLPIRIGKLEAGMRGFNPEVLLKDIQVEAGISGQQPDIVLKEIRLGFDFVDLLLTRDWLSSSRVTLVGARLSAIRSLDGHISIKGLQASEDKPLWLMRGGRYEILDSSLTWLDMKRQAVPMHFDRFDLLLKNAYADDKHELHLLSNLPDAYGHSLRLSAVFNGDVFQSDRLNGQLYIEGTDLQTSALLSGDLPLGLNLQSGAGDIRLWSLWRDSSPYHVMGYIQGQQIKISKNHAPPLRIDTFQGNFDWSNHQGRWHLSCYDLDLFTQKQYWPDGAFHLQQDAAGNIAAVIKQLDLPAAMFLAPLFISADQDYADWLKLNPSGRLRDVSFYANPDFQQFAARGHFERLGIDHFESFPQIQGISGDISLNERFGQLDLHTQDASINAADWFRNALGVKRLQGRLQWWQNQGRWHFFSPELLLNSTDFETRTRLNLLLDPANASPYLDLRTRFGQFNDISQVPKYLPAKIMDSGAVDWLDHAFVAGQIQRGEVHVQGFLDQFPFTQGNGRFETVFALENTQLQFNEDWPHLRDIYADVQFLAEDLQVAIHQGRSEKVDINQAVVTIPALADSEHVYVWGQVKAKIMHSLDFLQKSPLKNKIASVGKIINSESETRVDLDLKLPFSETDPVRVKVDAHLKDAQMLVKPVNLKVDAINGVLNFSEDLISSGEIDARSLGYPIQGRLNSDGLATYLNIDGTTNTEQLIKQFAFLQNDAVQGKLPYSLRLKLPHSDKQAGELNIQSLLKGISVDSQLGLAKSAEEEKSLNLDFQLDESIYLPLTLEYGKELQAAILIDKHNNSLYSGHIVLGQGSIQHQQQPGLKLDVRQPVFNLSQAIKTVNARTNQTGLPELKEVNIDTGQLLWQDRQLGAVQCRMQHADQLWQGSIDSEIAKGFFKIPDQRSGSNRISLQMDYLNLSAMDKLSFDNTTEVISDLPLIDIDSKRLLWRDMNLGLLKLQAERKGNDIHFKKFQLQNAGSKMDLTADWMQLAAGPVTQVQGNLKAEAFGQLLSELHVTDDIKETSADIEFKVGWRGGPHQFSLGKLNGQLQLELRDGRISSIEPGVGRLLGLIAMEQWVKRLSLDFSDIYRQGLTFDDIKGRFIVKDGQAYTEDLTVNAVAATFTLAGYVDLANKTVDQRVAVVPKSSDALPIAGTIVSGVAGLITRVVTDDYQEGYFLGSKYQLSGSLGNVEVTPLHKEDGLLNKTWRGLTDFGWLESVTK